MQIKEVKTKIIKIREEKKWFFFFLMSFLASFFSPFLSFLSFSCFPFLPAGRKQLINYFSPFLWVPTIISPLLTVLFVLPFFFFVYPDILSWTEIWLGRFSFCFCSVLLGPSSFRISVGIKVARFLISKMD